MYYSKNNSNFNYNYKKILPIYNMNVLSENYRLIEIYIPRGNKKYTLDMAIVTLWEISCY